MRFGSREKGRKGRPYRKAFVVFMVFGLLLMWPASAANGTATINWTQISDIITGVSGLFPSFVTLVSNALPILIFLGVIGFVLRFFDSIIDMIASLARFR
ncbi:hypothetical protein [Geoglobus acetivorans]|uniref:Uncharacterized protein n=1 Tax=Geoglobus acetivorans TaxID=565033 RepID=A0A0A7GJH6_GEOAI|nr:hypothetical protein GACE_2093 [Geoglobus acetivorans]